MSPVNRVIPFCRAEITSLSYGVLSQPGLPSKRKVVVNLIFVYAREIKTQLTKQNGGKENESMRSKLIISPPNRARAVI
jgi:hypothetical protein